MTEEVLPAIYYVGADDTTLDLFESQYPIPHGISYNSYVILDEKIAVMDTIDRRKTQEWLQHVDEVLQGRQPDYLVVQHMEPDHSASVGAFLEQYPHTTVVATAKALQMLPQYFEHTDFCGHTLAVKEGDKLCLGAHTLTFVLAPMVHWPEVMVSYEESQQVLFSADAFGKFGALSCSEPWTDEARRYFINIVGKYGVQVQALLKKAAALPISTICPLHGPVLKQQLAQYIALYDTWSKYEPEEDGVLVAYASIHGHTAIAAQEMAKILEQHGAKVITADLCRIDKAEAVAQAFRLKRMVVAASSYDAGVFTPMHDFLHRLHIKNYQKRTVGIIENGSWSPTAGKVMKGMLEGMKALTLAEPMVTIRGAMKQADRTQLETLAQAVLAD